VGTLIWLVMSHTTDIATIKANQENIKESVSTLVKTIDRYSDSVDKQIGHVVNVEQEQEKEMAAIKQAMQDAAKNIHRESFP
jgi:peptidoglycan hydrolase CwlO-like protein